MTRYIVWLLIVSSTFLYSMRGIGMPVGEYFKRRNSQLSLSSSGEHSFSLPKHIKMLDGIVELHESTFAEVYKQTYPNCDFADAMFRSTPGYIQAEQLFKAQAEYLTQQQFIEKYGIAAKEWLQKNVT